MIVAAEDLQQRAGGLGPQLGALAPSRGLKGSPYVMKGYQPNLCRN